MKERYIKRYGNAYELPSPNRDKLMEIFKQVCTLNDILYRPEDCFAYLHDFPEQYKQMSIFDLSPTLSPTYAIIGGR